MHTVFKCFMIAIQKSCQQCKSAFVVTDADLAFYDKVSPVIAGKIYKISAPTLCPDCRQQRRLSFRNERTFYHRKCDHTGKQIISLYSSDKPYTVYDHKKWYADTWDALQYGRNFDFNRPFFVQFKELQRAVPRPSLYLQRENTNCEYTNLTSDNKNCYLIVAASANEDCMYTTYLHRNKNVVDCFFIFDSELCYECIDCYNCYKLTFSQNCQNCSDSAFLYDCKGCSDCFGCVSLVNKQYHIFNQAYSKEEYHKKIAAFWDNRDAFEAAFQQFRELKKNLPHKYYAGLSNEDVTGDHISFSRHATDCFDCTYLEDCKYCTWLHNGRDCYDHYAWGQPAELCLENHLCGNNAYHVLFSEACWNDVRDLFYCQLCMNGSQNLFGCIGLQKKQYCILNKQYTQAEYETLVPRIIQHMQKTGEWGEFFSIVLSPFAYNETVAQTYFPLTEGQAVVCNYDWKEEIVSSVYEGSDMEIPWCSTDIPDDFTKQILKCEVTGKLYKIIPQELQFYRTMGLPIPRRSPDQRHKDRIAFRNPRKLWSRHCTQCAQEIQTTYAPDRPEKIYCEECYLKAVY